MPAAKIKPTINRVKTTNITSIQVNRRPPPPQHAMSTGALKANRNMDMSDQSYINKAFSNIDASKTDLTQARRADLQGGVYKKEVKGQASQKLLHEQAVQRYKESEVIRRNEKYNKQQVDPYADVSLDRILKKEPHKIVDFTPSVTIEEANGKGVYSVCYNATSTMISSTGHDRTLTLSRPNGVLAKKLVGHKAPTLQSHFSPCTRQIVVCAGDSLYIWQIENGILKAEWVAHGGIINGVQWSYSGKYLLSCSNDKTCKLWSVESVMKEGRKRDTVRGLNVECELKLPNEIFGGGHEDGVVKAVFSRDDEYIASCSKDGKIIIWSAKDTSEHHMGIQISTLTGHKSAVLCLAFNYSNTRLASCDNSGQIHVYDYKTNTKPYMVLSGHGNNTLYCVMWGRECIGGKGNGRLFSCGSDRKIIVWDEKTGEVLNTIYTGDPGWLMGIDIDITNNLVIIGGMDWRSSVVVYTGSKPTFKAEGGKWGWKGIRDRIFKTLFVLGII